MGALFVFCYHVDILKKQQKVLLDIALCTSNYTDLAIFITVLMGSRAGARKLILAY